MADRGGGDAWQGRPDCEATSDTGSLSDSDSDLDSDWDGQEAGLSPGEPLCLEEAITSEDDEPPAEPPQPAGSPARPFHLRGMSPTFSLRSRSIFEGLDGAARAPTPGTPALADTATFKRPLPPPGPLPRPGPPQVPDYVTHPERWTKYSLEDVPEGSDQSNHAVALQFLGDLKRRAGGQSPAPQQSCAPSFNQDPSSRGAGRIVFTKPAKAGERKRPPWREPGEELVALGHLGSAPGEGEGEERRRTQAEPQDADMREEEEPAHQHPAVPVGFHGSKKRSREHLRPKGTTEEEGEEA
ncbi:protein TSSC4 [Trichosurus vulpecula]|uniref:protein TSSC4 n=1 Tax=Trichosurus vulpecula TaxID=9337 RepID=UPI00186B2DDB|nr:protein TSSC4 [Trichosurus vulpecula]